MPWWNPTTVNAGAGDPYGSVPGAVRPQTSQNNAIAGNLGNVSNLYGLASGVGAASGAGGAANLNTALPGAGAAQEASLANINSDLAGVLNPDVVNQLTQQSAERGVGNGSIGSPNSNAALMKLLGLTSTGLQETGASELNALTASAPRGPEFNPASMLVSPAEQLQQENYNSSLAAAPDPGAAAGTNLAALNAGRSSGGGGVRLPAATPGSPSEAAYMASGQYDPGSTVAYGPQGGHAYQPPADMMSLIPGGTQYNANGAGGQTGLVDNGDGTQTDTTTGMTYDAYTGLPIDTGSTDTSGSYGGDTSGGDDSGE